MRKLLPLLLLLFATPALATDGVLEINQTCAVQTGCFSGDTAGFPVTITGAGGRSYSLTSDLLISNRNTTAISVTQRDTSIDLNGFEIVLSACQTLSCSPITGSGFGVLADNVLGVSVKNGSITGMGSDGVYLGNQAHVSGLRVRWNGRNGIYAHEGSTVSGNTAYQNGSSGIRSTAGSTVSDNTAYANDESGISALYGSTVSGNTAYQNGDDGINAAQGSTVSGNTANQNGRNGIQTGNGCTVSGNTAHQNSDYGLNLGFDSAYRGNGVTHNQTGTVTGSGSANSRGGNYCAGTGTGSSSCP